MLWMCSEVNAEEKEEIYFKKTQISISDFTVKVIGMNRNTAWREFRQLLLLMQAPTPNQRVDEKIVAVTFPQCEDMLSHYEERG